MALRASSILRVSVPAAMVIWIVSGLLLEEPAEQPDAIRAETPRPAGSVGPLLQGGEPVTAGEATHEPVAPEPSADPPSVIPQTFRVTVLLPNGAPATPACIVWSAGPARHNYPVWTDDQGVAHLAGLDPSRLYDIEVRPSRDRSDVLSFRMPNWAPKDQTIRLEVGLGISGHVVDEHRRPVLDHGMFYRLPSRPGEHWRAVLDERGAFQLTHLPAGPVEVCVVFNSPWRPQAPEGFAAGDVINGLALRTIEAGTSGVVLRVTRGAVLRLVIQDWQRKTMPSYRIVTLQGMEGGASHTGPLDYSGRVAFKRLEPNGRYRATLFGLPGNLMLDARDLAPGAADQVVRLSTGCRLSGQLFAPGVPGDRLRVFAVRGARKLEGIVDERTGDFAFEGLPLGRWQVQASAVVLREGQARTLRASGEMECGGRLELTLSDR